MASTLSVATGQGTVSALRQGPAEPDSVIVLAHGAGGGMRSDFMESIAGGLAGAGLGVVRFNFPYSEAGRRSPDRAPVLEQTWRDVVAHVRTEAPAARVLAGGKSMGGRMASHAAASADGLDVAGIVFLGYPLHPPGRPHQMRDEHLPAVTAPMLFVAGTRDPFCPLVTLRTVLERRRIAADVVVVADGDHSFKVRSSSGRTTRQAWAEVVDAVVAWVDRL